MYKKKWCLFSVFMVALLPLTSCGRVPSQSVPTQPVLTQTPNPTYTPYPTYTAFPTFTPFVPSVPTTVATAEVAAEVTAISGSPINILWIENCDPRNDPDFCHISKDLKEFDQFYGTIAGLGGTLSYKIPTSEDSFAPYDVVVANFCSTAIHENEIALLVNYVFSGGSVIALGDNFCNGVGPVNGEWLNSAQAASMFTQNWGVSITSDDDTSLVWAGPALTHPLTQNMNNIYAFRHAYLVVESPSKILFSMGDKPFISLYDQTGVVITIPNVGFHWGTNFRSEIADSDNFSFWRNMLNWLAMQSRNKLK